MHSEDSPPPLDDIEGQVDSFLDRMFRVHDETTATDSNPTDHSKSSSSTVVGQ